MRAGSGPQSRSRSPKSSPDGSVGGNSVSHSVDQLLPHPRDSRNNANSTSLPPGGLVQLGPPPRYAPGQLGGGSTGSNSNSNSYLPKCASISTSSTINFAQLRDRRKEERASRNMELVDRMANYYEQRLTKAAVFLRWTKTWAAGRVAAARTRGSSGRARTRITSSGMPSSIRRNAEMPSTQDKQLVHVLDDAEVNFGTSSAGAHSRRASEHSVDLDALDAGDYSCSSLDIPCNSSIEALQLSSAEKQPWQVRPPSLGMNKGSKGLQLPGGPGGLNGTGGSSQLAGKSTGVSPLPTASSMCSPADELAEDPMASPETEGAVEVVNSGCDDWNASASVSREVADGSCSTADEKPMLAAPPVVTKTEVEEQPVAEVYAKNVALAEKVALQSADNSLHDALCSRLSAFYGGGATDGTKKHISASSSTATPSPLENSLTERIDSLSHLLQSHG